MYRQRNIYVYDAVTLWVAYGLTTAFAALVLIAGLVAMLLNNAAYDTNFSTILRASRVSHPAMTDQAAMNLTRDGGSRPVPRALAGMIIEMNDQDPSDTGSEAGKCPFGTGVPTDTGHADGPELTLLMPAKRVTL